jgi:hypothetical protein
MYALIASLPMKMCCLFAYSITAYLVHRDAQANANKCKHRGPKASASPLLDPVFPVFQLHSHTSTLEEIHPH